MDLIEALNSYYQSHDEDARLRSRHGCVEFLTTVRYIDKYLRPGMKILDIGAGTGIYSHHYARQGYEVDAVELIEHNIEKFRANTQPGEGVTIWQADAVCLDFIESDTYDITLLMGPMYHLLDDKSKHGCDGRGVSCDKARRCYVCCLLHERSFDNRVLFCKRQP